MSGISNLFDKIFIIFCLTVAIYITAICPCKVILNCHLQLFYALLLIVLLYIFIKKTIYIK